MKLVALFFALAIPLLGANRYVDSDRPDNSGDGLSWATAKKTVPGTIGGTPTGWNASPGDTVYISGGSPTKTYTFSSYWEANSGTSGNTITYKIGQDAGHNGTAVFNLTGTATQWFVAANYFHVSGDAGDGQCHFKLTGNWNGMWYGSGGGSITGRRFSYIDCMDGIATLGSHQNSRQIEVDHNRIRVVSTNGSVAMGIFSDIDEWGSSSVHHNYIEVPYREAGIGIKGASLGGTGIDFYENTIVGYQTNTYVAEQHQDAFQHLGNGSKIRCWNNTIVNMGNYGFYFEAYTGGFTDILCWNNVFTLTDPALKTGSGAMAIAMGVNSSFIGTPPAAFTRVVFANNLVMDYTYGGIGLNNASPVEDYTEATFTDCFVVNNVFVNSGTVVSQGNTTSTISNNVSVSAANAASYFVSYSTNGGLDNNMRLTSNATTLVNAGYNIAAQLPDALDKAGTARPVGAAWDVGPYELVGDAALRPVLLRAGAASLLRL